MLQQWQKETLGLFGPHAVHTSLQLGQIEDVAETKLGLWLAGDEIWRVEDGRAHPIRGLPPVGKATLIEPMDPGRIAIAVEAGILILDLEPN